MSLRFRPLAQVEFLHDYFSDGKCDMLRAVPSPDTERKLNEAGILWRMIGNKLVLVAKVNGTKLRKPLAPGTSFRFYLLPTSEAFFAVSNLGFDAVSTKRYFFSNRSGVSDGGTLFLSQEAAAYDAAKTYAPGDLVLSGGNLFEAIRPSAPGNVHGTADTGWWMAKEEGHYANSADLLEFAAGSCPFPISPAATSVTTAIWSMNPATGAFDVPVRSAETVNHGEAQSQTNIPLTALVPNRYRLEVNGVSRVVYYDEEAVARKVFAVIEIQTDLPSSHTHSLFEPDGDLVNPSPVYSLRIPARRVRWKYIARTADVTAIKDSNEDLAVRLQFAADGPQHFLSTKPIALRETPVSTLFLESTQLGEVKPIASASPHGLSTCTVDTDVLLCSEIRLNH